MLASEAKAEAIVKASISTRNQGGAQPVQQTQALMHAPECSLEQPL